MSGGQEAACRSHHPITSLFIIKQKRAPETGVSPAQAQFCSELWPRAAGRTAGARRIGTHVQQQDAYRCHAPGGNPGRGAAQGRVEEFDFESAARKLLRGNIYLAKVTRVEPSLQAAFVEYGGNRHGFLAFNEIHPDYYQIPMADRQALLEEEAAAEAEEEAAVDAHAEALAAPARQPLRARRTTRSSERRAARAAIRARDGDDEHDTTGDDDHRRRADHRTMAEAAPPRTTASPSPSAHAADDGFAANENTVDDGDLDRRRAAPRGTLRRSRPSGESEGGVHEVEATARPPRSSASSRSARARTRSRSCPRARAAARAATRSRRSSSAAR